MSRLDDTGKGVGRVEHEGRAQVPSQMQILYARSTMVQRGGAAFARWRRRRDQEFDGYSSSCVRKPCAMRRIACASRFLPPDPGLIRSRHMAE
jgi:hypothetical protein